ncbi:MAG: c-type cytochrome [Fibrobacterales bacterium]
MDKKDTQNNNLSHEGVDYDGIIEQDNPPPKWIMYLFYASIIFSFTYMGYYMAKENAINEITQNTENPLGWTDFNYDASVKKANAEIKKSGAPQSAVAVDYTKPELIVEGEKIYASNCIACHAAKGVGLVGPALVDKYSTEAGSLVILTKSISEGTPEKGMPGWKAILGDSKIEKLKAYILSLNTGKVVESATAQGASPEGDATNGAKLYSANCVTCHGIDGVGSIGPALTTYDAAATPKLIESIGVGVPAKGMPGWKAILGNQKIADIGAYIVTLKK